MQKITITLTPGHNSNGRFMDVSTELAGINLDNGGADALKSIAANCIRLLASRDGLEKALDDVADFTMNDTRVRHV